MLFCPRSFSCCSFSPCPLNPSCSTGTLDALYWMMNGGVDPGGRLRSCTWQIAVTCDTASPTFTCGWKKILIRPIPFSDCDSIWSMSFTVVVMPRSLLNTMRFDISCAERPE